MSISDEDATAVQRAGFKGVGRGEERVAVVAWLKLPETVVQLSEAMANERWTAADCIPVATAILHWVSLRLLAGAHRGYQPQSPQRDPKGVE
jgi:hypothetical protein